MNGQDGPFYEFKPFLVDLSKGVLLRDGEPIPLPPKAFETLVVLVQNRGRLQQKDELLKQIWPDTFVEEGNLSQNVSLLRKALGEGPDDHRYIQTVPRRGYRFVAEVREYSDLLPELQIRHRLWPPPHRWLAAGIGVAALFCLLYFMFTGTFRRNAAAVRLRSIAVLPFRNVNGEKDIDYLADGITDELITRLTRLKEMRVISYSTARRFKGSGQDAAEIGRRLGVDGVVEGALRKSGSRLRMNIHLIDSNNGFEIWADERFESAARDLLDTESLLAEAIARQLRGTVLADERTLLSKGGTSNVDAFDALLRGKQYLLSEVPTESELARQMFQRAIQLDSSFADAYGWLAYVLGEQLYFGQVKPDQAELALAAANKGLSLDPHLLIARRALIKIYGCYLGRMEETVKQIKIVQESDQNSTDGRDALGYGYFVTGFMDKAIPIYEKLVAEEPLNEGFRSTLAWFYLLSEQFDKGIHVWQPLLAQDRGGIWGVVLYAHQGQIRQAIEAGERHLRKAPPDHPEFWVYLGNAYERAGRHENARQTWAEGTRQLEAKFSVLDSPYSSCSLGVLYAALAQREKALNVVRKALAGHPDQAFFCAGLAYAKLGDQVQAIRLLDRAAKSSNATLFFMDLYARPDGPFYKLRDDPQFLSVRTGLLRQIEELRTRL